LRALTFGEIAIDGQSTRRDVPAPHDGGFLVEGTHMDRHEVAALKTERLEAQRAAKVEGVSKEKPPISTEGQHTAAPSPWLRNVNEYARRQRCEFQVARFG
jgi:hypothetical protein